jgi:hypothetical protein
MHFSLFLRMPIKVKLNCIYLGNLQFMHHLTLNSYKGKYLLKDPKSSLIFWITLTLIVDAL